MEAIRCRPATRAIPEYTGDHFERMQESRANGVLYGPTAWSIPAISCSRWCRTTVTSDCSPPSAP